MQSDGVGVGATSLCRSGGELQQQIAVFSLGFSSTDCYNILMEELQPLIEDYTTERIKVS